MTFGEGLMVVLTATVAVLGLELWRRRRAKRRAARLREFAALPVAELRERARMVDWPRGRVRAVLDRLFEREDIGTDGCLYLERWHVLHAFGFRLYLHRFRRSDQPRDLHDHPNSFWTLPLVGHYWDETEEPVGDAFETKRVRRLVRWPLPRFRRAEHAHRVVLDDGARKPWTLVLMFPRRRSWGFHTPHGWVHWKDYLGLRAPEAERWEAFQRADREMAEADAAKRQGSTPPLAILLALALLACGPVHKHRPANVWAIHPDDRPAARAYALQLVKAATPLIGDEDPEDVIEAAWETAALAFGRRWPGVRCDRGRLGTVATWLASWEVCADAAEAGR